MKRACVVGWPIEHSRSPMIHGYWLAAYGIDGTYEKVAVRPEDAEAFFRSLAAKGLAGCNVTVPLKEIAIRAADVVDPTASAVGAANTLWLEDGRLHAANTDTYGFMTHLDASAPGWRDADGHIAVLGAGGAARAIVFGLIEAGAGDIRIYNRTRARAETLAAEFGPRVRAEDWEARIGCPAEAALVINTTTIGMKGEGELGLDFSRARPGTTVADIVYVPLETRFLADARAAGLAVVDGLGMLLHQAVPGFEKWFGVRPDVTPELRALVVADLGDA